MGTLFNLKVLKIEKLIEVKKKVAFEKRLAKCSNIITLGVLPDFSNYLPDNRQIIFNAEKIYYPSVFYADIFDAMGKKIFPSCQTYRFVQDKIKQTAIFNMLNISHPRTKIYYGNHQKKRITDDFKFPFIAKIPKGSALGRGVFLIKNSNELESYKKMTHAAYIQEYLESDRDVRVVIIGDKVAHAYWRIAKKGEFRSNIEQGGTVSLADVPDQALDLALYTAKKCGWNDVGIDIIKSKNRYYIIEANMKYGKEGFRKAGINYHKLMEKMIDNEEI